MPGAVFPNCAILSFVSSRPTKSISMYSALKLHRNVEVSCHYLPINLWVRPRLGLLPKKRNNDLSHSSRYMIIITIAIVQAAIVCYASTGLPEWELGDSWISAGVGGSCLGSREQRDK